MSEYVVKLLIMAMVSVESPKTPEQAQAAIKREGAYGCLQIRELCLADVNDFTGTHYVLADVENDCKLSMWVLEQYSKRYKCDTPEKIARVWNGGPNGMNKPATLRYWQKVQEQMAIIQFNMAAERVRKLYGRGL